MRKYAREVAFCKVFETLFNSTTNVDGIFDFTDLTKQEDIDFANTLVKLALDHHDEIESLISENLKDYSLDRLYRVDRAILILAIAELKYYAQTPEKVVINEAVNLAKKYGTEKSYSFVNGVLKSIIEEK